MGVDAKELKVVDGSVASDPVVGGWLWALQDTRRDLLEALERVTPAMIDWVPADGRSSIGTVLYHIADIEADWLYVEVLEGDLPPAVAALFPFGTRDAAGKLTHVPGFSLEQHLQRLETVRALLVAVFQDMNVAEFRRVRSFEHYDVTPEWILHHLIQHEAEHRGQIGSIRDEAESVLAAG